MRAAGIVCEYNPFHMGHMHHLRETRRTLGEDTTVICVMSGNVVQRGEFAMFSKYARAKAALKCGADLVVEIPSVYVLTSAERYASAAVSILQAVGASHISFGSESGNTEELEYIAKLLNSPELEALLPEKLGSGISYAAARQAAAEELAGKRLPAMKNPNDILGIEYIRAVLRAGGRMKPAAVKRMGAGHDEREYTGTFASASALREIVSAGGDMSEYVPEAAMECFREELDSGRGPVKTGSFDMAVMAKLRSMEECEYAELPDASEGLHMRLMKSAQAACTLEEVLQMTKSKRYAMSRLRRMVMCAFLGIRAGDSAAPPPYVRVLAANSAGCGLLRDVERLPVITKPASARSLEGHARRVFDIETRCTDLRALGCPIRGAEPGGAEFRRSPYIIKG